MEEKFIEYLGLGYNIKQSSPIGNDVDDLIDLAYKEPVISFENSTSVVGKGSEINLPLGVWIRNESLCYRTSSVIKSENDKVNSKIFTEDIKLNMVNYEYKLENKSLNKLLTRNNLRIKKINCSIHTSGMIISYQWNLKKSILILLNKIQNKLVNDSGHSSSNNSQLNQKNIEKYWYNIFNTYGTHVLTKITLGGKVIEINTADGSENTTKDTSIFGNKFDLNFFKTSLNSISKDNIENLDKNEQEKIMIFGGNAITTNRKRTNNYGEINYVKKLDKQKWIETIKYNPVPIKFELTPLSYFIYQNFSSSNPQLNEKEGNKLNLIIKNYSGIINNLEYLGSGYSFDRLEQRVNNFKAPIIEIRKSTFVGNLAKNVNNYWIDVQNQFICDISTEELNIENEDELEKRLYTHVHDSYLDSYSSYNNNEYTHDDMLHTLNKYNKLLIKTYKCIVYKANLTTLDFLKNINDENRENSDDIFILKVLRILYKNCNSEFDSQKCPISKFKDDPFNPNCIKCVMPWVQFFKDYGTSLTKQITMGGVINKFYNLKRYDGSMNKEYKKKTVKESSTFFHLSKYKSESMEEKNSGESDKEELEEVYTLTIGPEPPGNVANSNVISDWLEKVIQNPTPIDFELVPLIQIIPDKYLKVYENALKYYQKLYNISDLNGVNTVNSLVNTLRRGNGVVKILNEEMKNVKVCGKDERVMFGFCMSLGKNGELKQVQLLSNKINVCLFTKTVSRVLTWSICAHYNEQVNDFKQLILRPNYYLFKELKCPRDMKIFIGIKVNIKDPIEVELCESKESTCVGTNKPNEFLWILCVPQTVNTALVKSLIKTGGKHVENECPNKYKMLYGVKFLFSNDEIGFMMESCNKFYNKCDINCNNYIIKKINKNKKIPSLEYLGCGYDILFGNPLSDPELLVDPGFRDPIISYSIMFKKEKLFRKISYSNITNAWIRPLIECKRSNSRSVVDSMEKYKDMISVDSDIGVSSIDESAKFSLSANYSEINDLLKNNKNKIYVDKSYCFLLEAALPIHNSLKITKSFATAMNKLSKDFSNHTKDCNPIKYTDDKNSKDCKEIKKWMDLFEQFGTHFSYNIKLGGRITYITQEEGSKEEKENEKSGGAKIGHKLQKDNKGIGIEGNVQLIFGNKKGENKNLSFKYTNILGGLPVSDINKESEYVKWIKSVYKYPMPIRTQFAPISKIFKSKALKDSYDEAFRFYLNTSKVK
ncbi:perforin-related protein, putative [Theileria annulata]|uniref:Perforin-related protein, putative n=1 Tax=Theileria annulata TaxID=5874 RepID=Q4UAZ8_THEAN|nr:perforin-related protein, putative [Theileria annulata]CAI76003.1 perforin-related protein, putative [Theileria annulata]|eukprot:XP_955479.1 perforin-related protein, putative [Theileria annulata]